MVSLALLAVITITIAWIIIYTIYLILKKNKKEGFKRIEIFPFIFLWKTKKFNERLIRTGTKRTKLFLAIGELSIIYGLSIMLYALFFLTKNLLAILAPVKLGQAAPIIPLIFGITFTPPLDQLIIILLIIVLAVVTHEMFHGFLASSHKIGIKSSGAGIFYVIPLGFVELEENSLEKAPSKSKLKVYGAGTFINFVEGILFLALLISFPLAIAWGFSMESQGVLVFSIVEGSPAEKSDIQIGDAIIAINGTLIKDFQSFTNFLAKTKPNQTVILLMERNLQRFNLTLTLAKHPNLDKGFIGVATLNYYRPLFEFIPSMLQYYIYLFLGWGAIICLSLAIINMLPIPMLDGDKFLGELLSRIKRKDIKAFMHNTIRFFAFFILISNIFFSLMPPTP